MRLPHLLAHTLLIASVSCGISSGYVKPASPTAIDDQAYVLQNDVDLQELFTRYDKLKADVSPTVHRYNAYWQAFESSAVPSSTQPVECPTGYEIVPPDPAQLEQNGGLYNRYRCMLTAQIAQIRDFLNVDDELGWESGAIIWCIPPAYRDPACLGMPQAASQSAPENFTVTYQAFTQTYDLTRDKSARLLQDQVAHATENGTVSAQSALDSSGCNCAPRVDALSDYSDFVTFLASYMSEETSGHFTHFVAFNEVANSAWFDLSGTSPGSIDVTKEPTPADVDTWIDRYSQILRTTHDALSALSLAHPVVIYVSTDRYWSPPPVFTQWNGNRAHIGSGVLVEGIWARIGTEKDWSLAVHPYGEPLVEEFDGQNGIVDAYSFVSLTDVAAQMLTSFKQYGSGDPGVAPQLWMAATEQGWTSTDYDSETRAKFLCQSHNITLHTPEVYWVAMNDFQNAGSDVYGLLPQSSGPTLDNADVAPEYQAYKSLRPGVWGTSSHYCCTVHQVGCQT